MDDQDLNEWLKQQSQDADVAQPSAPDNRWSAARELMNKQNAMRYEAPGELRAPIKAEALPEKDSWKTILAMALDVIGNKGKGLGSIAMADTEMRNKQIADWRSRNSPQALDARRMQQIQMRNADRQGFDAERRVLGEQAGQEMRIAQAQLGEEQAQAQAIQRAAEHQDTVDYQDRSLAAQSQQAADRLAQADRHFQGTQRSAAAGRSLQLRLAQEAAQQRAALAQQQQEWQGTQNQLNRDATSALHDKDNEARRGLEEIQARARAEAMKQRTLAQHGVLPEGVDVPVIPGTSIKDRDRWNSLNPTARNEAMHSVQTHQRAMQAFSTLENLLSQPRTAANRNQYNALVKELIGDKSKEGSTGVLSNTEYERYIADLPEYGTTRVGQISDFTTARDVLMGGRNPAVDTIKQAQQYAGGKYDSVLSTYGLGPEQQQEDPTNGLAAKYNLEAY